MNSYKIKLFLIALIIIIVDQLSKWHIKNIKQDNNTKQNYFKVYENLPLYWILIYILLIGYFIYIYIKDDLNNRIFGYGLSLWLGGVMSRTLELIYYKYSIIFPLIIFSINFTSNIANIFILLGIILIISSNFIKY